MEEHEYTRVMMMMMMVLLRMLLMLMMMMVMMKVVMVMMNDGSQQRTLTIPANTQTNSTSLLNELLSLSYVVPMLFSCVFPKSGWMGVDLGS